MTTAPPARRVVPADLFERLVALRRDLHRHPELSFHEERTATRVAAEAEALGLSARRGVGGHGVVVDLPGASDAPRVALRADLDALPVTEQTGLPFASEVPGVMHACGHDGHTAMLLGAAELLVAGAPPPAPVRLIWQPAEERSAGARAMIADGVLDGVGAIFGVHLDAHHPAGTLVVTEGVVNASTDAFAIEVRGRGGHGGRPHETIDAVVLGSLIVAALQTIVSREIDPAQPAVVSVGVFRAGSAPNVIAGQAHLEGTIRAHRPEVRRHLVAAVERVARGVAATHGGEAEFRRIEGTPPVINAPAMTAIAREAARAVVGPEGVRALTSANMGGEDFACYLERVPGSFVRVGGAPADRLPHAAHSDRFDFHEDALAVGAAWFAEVARRAGRVFVAAR